MTPRQIIDPLTRPADEYADFSKELGDVRRKMRAKILALGDEEMQDLYYRAITLSEHEAGRRMLVKGRT